MLDTILGLVDAKLAVVVASAALGGFMRGFVGFGTALVTVPVLSLAFGPKMGIAISSVMGIPTLLQLLPEAIRESERKIVVPVGLATLAATPIGSWVLVTLSPGVMKIVISALVIGMTAMLARGWTMKSAVSLPILLASGAAGGLVQGAAGMGGPPVVAMALSRPGNIKAQRGNVLGLMTAVALSSLPPLIWYGLYTREAIIIGLMLVPVSLFTTALGARYFARGGQQYYRRAALATLAVVGLATLIIALKDQLAH